MKATKAVLKFAFSRFLLAQQSVSPLIVFLFGDASPVVIGLEILELLASGPCCWFLLYGPFAA
jgi:hypothetical protein